MKIEFYCDAGANIHSRRKETFSLDDLGITAEEWAEMDEDARYKMAEEWAWEKLSIGCHEVKE